LITTGKVQLNGRVVWLSSWEVHNGDRLEIAETLRDSNPNIGLVFITGLPINKVISMAMNMRPFRVVPKPCEFYQLFEAVQEMIPEEFVNAYKEKVP
jgi:DNA-binding NarL/FixJ family response regulator